MGLNFSYVLVSCVTLYKVVDISNCWIPICKSPTIIINYPALRLAIKLVRAQVLVHFVVF